MLSNSRTSGSANAAWWFVLIAAIAGISAALLLPHKDVESFRRLAGNLLEGCKLTAKLMLLAGTFSTVLGVVIGVLRSSSNKVLNFIGSVYVEVFRGIPLYVMLLFVYFGVISGVNRLLMESGSEFRVDRFWSAVLALSICGAAYIAEAVRAGIEAIPVEEIEAASLEGTKVQVLWHIILPQAFRMILPAWTNEMVAMLKDTSLVGGIALADITQRARDYSSSTAMYFESFAAVALIYLVLTLILSKLARSLERAWHADPMVEGN